MLAQYVGTAVYWSLDMCDAHGCCCYWPGVNRSTDRRADEVLRAYGDVVRMAFVPRPAPPGVDAHALTAHHDARPVKVRGEILTARLSWLPAELRLPVYSCMGSDGWADG